MGDTFESFIASILASDAGAKVIALGDLNEYPFAARFRLADLDDVVGLPAAERYTYLYAMNARGRHRRDAAPPRQLLRLLGSMSAEDREDWAFVLGWFAIIGCWKRLDSAL
ncbi:hypothetical protein F4780DRAFT_780099 [Xylariomycetidae sp. FL0641]|nr:hypothetical protein F4780DRAFT_780099 [Xylariomycetidae sp. FL0641]